MSMDGSPWYMATDGMGNSESIGDYFVREPAAPTAWHDYSIGDHVELTTGGPTMVVLDVCGECGDIDVAWFNGTTMEIVTLPSVAVWHAYDD
ncbi:hypothetical protein EB231_34965 [Mesorhizobium sp. NZP2298]|nr:hypothetical protein EB231_34965 [Mesorhizobium sp. NZP2298]